MNAKAAIDLPGFQASIATQFNVPLPQVEATVKVVEKPADAFMVYQVAQYAAKPPAQTLETYKTNKGKGWGAIAQAMGIKPGSAEFHKLKNGDLSLKGVSDGGGDAHGKGKGHGKGKD